MRLVPRAVGATVSVFTLLTTLSGSTARASDPFQDKVVPFLNDYCLRCHNAKTKNGELDLSTFTSAAKVVEDFRQWEHVLTFVKREEMPPEKAKQPPAAL